MFGSEQGTAYSELIDPLDQRARLMAQSLLAAAGDPEAMQVDEDFLQALEYGMPPTGGMGLGIDRLVMNLTGLSIRDTILFPLVRPERGRSVPARRDGAPASRSEHRSEQRSELARELTVAPQRASLAR